MARFSPEGHRVLQAPDDESGVSEVVGFLLTFGIIATILLVAMLGFNDAQQRAEVRLVEIQGASAAQRVASAAVDLALFAEDNPYDTAVAIDLPTELQGFSYSVQVCGATGDPCGDGATYCTTHACPYVKVTSSRGTPQYQSTFLLVGKSFCTTGNAASGGIVLVTYSASSDCIGLRDETA